jgi:hypothetical protein
MSHYITVPINENGVITDEHIQGEVTIGCSKRFGVTDVFLYSHGWWTNAIRALVQYNRFSTEFTDKALEIAAITPPPLKKLPAKAFGIGLHWPSMISEDPNSPADFAQVTTFYTMEKRADTIGEHGLYAILRMIIEANQQTASPLRFHFLGHSFGCKVVCSSLETIANDMSAGTITTALDINVVLLQAAFENNAFESGQGYAAMADSKLDLRVLVTRSELDLALKKQFPLARAINIFAKNKDRMALGYGGPTDASKQRFGGCYDLTVNPGFNHGDFKPSGERLVCADITPIHQANQSYPSDRFGGHHSDINIKELYELIAGFLFQ